MTSLNRFHFHRSSHSGKIFSNSSSSRKFRFSPEARMALESNISLQPLPFLPSCWKWINILQIVGHYDEHIPNPSREVGGSVEFLLENELTSATFLVLGVPPTPLLQNKSWTGPHVRTSSLRIYACSHDRCRQQVTQDHLLLVGRLCQREATDPQPSNPLVFSYFQLWEDSRKRKEGKAIEGKYLHPLTFLGSGDSFFPIQLF